LTTAYCEWLPASALHHPECKIKLRQVVQDWASHWLGGQRSYNVSCEMTQTGLRARTIDWALLECGIYFDASKDSQALLVMALLDAPQGTDLRPKTDHRLAMLFLQKALDDLNSLFTAEFGSVRKTGVEIPGIDIYITLADLGSVFCLRVPGDVLVKFRKSICPDWEAKSRFNFSLNEVLGCEKVAFEVHVGSTTITAAELKSLAPGDIIRLDRDLESCFDLFGSRTKTLLGNAVLAAAGAQMALKAVPQQGLD
jgi:hypothetical protein